MYLIENYKDSIRFNRQYEEISKFLQIVADNGYNEHFHWGRFDWGMTHSYLDVEMLSRNALFRRENGELVGAIMYDTDYNDRWYIIHSISDENLLGQMIEYVTEADGNTAIIKANLNDTILCRLLVNAGFDNQNLQSVLEIDLSRNHE